MSSRPPPPPPRSRASVSAFAVHRGVDGLSSPHHSAYTRQTRTYEPDDPELQSRRVRPFRLSDLERYSIAQRDALHALQRALPETIFAPGISARLRSIVQNATGLEVDLWLHGMRVLPRSHLKTVIPGTTFLAVVGLPPLDEKLIVEVDLAMVYKTVDRLLGGHGVHVDVHRPVTETEEGVFSFLLLKVMQLFQTELTAAEQVALRLEDMRSDLRATADLLRTAPEWLVVSFRVNVDLDVGYVRVLVPLALATRLVPEAPPAGSTLAEHRRAHLESRLGRLGDLQTEGRVLAGRIDLSPHDLAHLDPGDIVLFDHTELQLDDGVPYGRARLMIGLGRTGLYSGSLEFTEAGTLGFRIEELRMRRIPSPHDPQLVHGVPGDAEGVIAEYEAPPDGYADAQESTPERRPFARERDLEAFDEDWGVDAQNSGGDYDEYGYEEQGEYAEGEYQEGEYAEGEYAEGYDQGQGEYAEGEYQENQYGEEGYAEAGYGEAQPVSPEALLTDVPVAVSVEIGRVQLTADEVLRLQAGHLVELGRSPRDPVDLVVGGRLLAKGELVEIEGSLGVKILQLMKDGAE